MEFLDLPDIRIAYRRHGSGPPLILLHGWPEWSAIWNRNIPVLAERFEVVAPDLRNFGDSTGAEARDLDHYLSDLEALADNLGFRRFGLVGHDVGAYIAQEYARRHPDRLAGLFFFDCPHFGLGRRWVEGRQIREIWYQSFNQLPLARDLVGASRETCRIYLRHFLSHWASDPRAFDDALEDWVETFMKPGRLDGGFRWYAAANARRLAALMDGAASDPPPIAVPARSLWGADDPILRVEWQDTLKDLFVAVELKQAAGAGHFVPWECPDLANAEMADFFAGQFAGPG